MSADTIVPRPSDPQSLNRFAFVRNNPLKYVDPSGHCFGLAAGADTLACLGSGASLIAAVPIILMGVTGGILLASTYCAAEGCGATWSEPQYESVPLTVASEPQIYASPVAGGQTTMLLTTPIDHQTSIPLVDPFPTNVSNPLVGPVTSIVPWEVGEYEELRSRRDRFDNNIEIHHVPQKHPVGQVIPGYDSKTGSAIAVPKNIHRGELNARNIRGKYEGTPSQLVKKDKSDLSDVGASQSAINKLHRLIEHKYGEHLAE
jgi:hypothetical protein